MKLSADLSPEQRQGRVGEVVAKAYSKLIIQRMKAGQPAAAAKQCAEMFERVPDYVKDIDRRRFNRILVQMDKAGKKHDHTPVEAVSPSSLPLFTLSDDPTWTLDGERKLESDERPDPAFDIAAIDAAGTWLLDRSGSSTSRPEVKSVLRRADRLGLVVGERPLPQESLRTSPSLQS